MVLATRHQRPHGPQGGLATQTSGRIGPIPRFGTILVLALLAMGSPAVGQRIGPNVPATAAADVQNEPQVAAFGNTLVAVWYRQVLNRYSGWGLSLDGGGTWIDGGGFRVVDPSGEATAGQPTVCVDQAGRFYAATVYTAAGWGVAVYRGTPQAGSLSWEGPFYAVVPTLPGSDVPRPLDAVRLTCDPERGYLYLSYTLSRGVADGQYEYTIQFVRSLDGGTTWSMPLVLSSGIASNGSRPAVGPDGEVYVVWEDFATRQVLGRRSADLGASFGPPFVVGEIRDNLGTPPPGWRPPVWRLNPLFQPPNIALASDFPSLAVDRSIGPHRGRLYVTWTDYAEGSVGAAGGLSVDLEPNNGYAGATAVAIGDDIRGFTQGVDFGGADPDLYTFTGTAGTMIQLTGRVTDVFPAPSRPLGLGFSLYCGEDTLRLTRIADGEAPIGIQPPPPLIFYSLPADGRYYLSTGGGMSSFWYEFSLRAVSPLGGQAARDHRDVVLTWSDDGGGTWMAKRRVSDAPPRYDESFPAVGVDEQGRVHLAWYDRRDDQTCGDVANTYWMYSTDGGVSFVAAQRLSTEGSSWNFVNSDHDSNIGDQLGMTTSGGRVYVLWTDTRGLDADIYAVRIDDLPTGIAVPRFTAEPSEGHVALLWTVSDATGIVGFRLHRADGERGDFEPLDETSRLSVGPGDYRAEDHAVSPGRGYRYRLEVMREGGLSDWDGPVSVVLPSPITRLAWESMSPNPFTRAVRMELMAPRAGDAWVRVYDLTGHEVNTLHQGALTPGIKMLTWEGNDQAGRPVPPGVYLVRADLAGESATWRVVRIR